MASFARIALIATGVAVAGFLGFKAYEHQQERAHLKALSPLISEANQRLANALDIEKTSGRITYQELFDRLDKDASSIDDLILKAQALNPGEYPNISEPAVAYLRLTQESLRGTRSLYRSLLALKTATDWAKQKKAQLDDASGSLRGVYYDIADKAVNDMKKANAELQLARSLTAASYLEVSQAQANLPPGLAPAVRIPAKQLSDAADRVSPTLATPSQ